MARLNVAKSVLLDRETRASYDQLRAARWRPAPGVARPTPAAAVAASVASDEHGALRARQPGQRAAAPPRRVGQLRSVRRAATSTARPGVLLIVALPLDRGAGAVRVPGSPGVRAAAARRAADLNLAQAPAVRPTATGRRRRGLRHGSRPAAESRAGRAGQQHDPVTLGLVARERALARRRASAVACGRRGRQSRLGRDRQRRVPPGGALSSSVARRSRIFSTSRSSTHCAPARIAFCMASGVERPWATMHTPLTPSSGTPPYSS